MNAKDMGMFICKLRKENNMTQMELAQQLHVTDKAVSRWERGIGYPDIQLLPALSESLHISVAELISCKKSLNYSNEEVTNIIHNLDVYKMESFRQDRKADKISLVCMIFVAACVYISGHGSIIGSLCIGTIFAMAVIGLYYLYYDNSTKRIYAFFSLLGLLLFIQFLIFMGMDYRWISYILMLYIIVILNMICR
ncbi:helix-turn-helix transcriptional regulator [Holdemanella sp.]|uniref:helix-turn-helix domain-containing protein n=1 Tax=Holdemanella sp. TaxID=1971762 RepID=UPI00307AE3A9